MDPTRPNVDSAGVNTRHAPAIGIAVPFERVLFRVPLGAINRKLEAFHSRHERHTRAILVDESTQQTTTKSRHQERSKQSNLMMNVHGKIINNTNKKNTMSETLTCSSTGELQENACSFITILVERTL